MKKDTPQECIDAFWAHVHAPKKKLGEGIISVDVSLPPEVIEQIDTRMKRESVGRPSEHSRGRRSRQPAAAG
jgi:hypothetical protein